MPIREIICPKHGKFEKILPMYQKVKIVCPVCGQKATIEEFSVPAKRNPDFGIQR